MSDHRDSAPDAGGGAASQEGARVFVSYSRRNTSEASALRDALVAAGFDAYLDIHDIAPGEPWRERLGGLIANAEKVVFLISEGSVASEICAWEVEEAERLGKSILPVVLEEVSPDRTPGRLSRLNFIFMRTEAERRESLATLVSALKTDLDWEREKARIGQAAAGWDAAGRPRRLLITRSDAIAASEAWRDGHPAGAPAPTETQRAYIAASRAAHGRRQRAFGGVMAVVAAAMAGLAVFAVVQRDEATSQRDQAELQRNAALRASSAQLASQARGALAEGEAVQALLLALEALPDPTARDPIRRARPYVTAARDALNGAMRGLRFVADAGSHTAAFSPDGAMLAVLGAADVALWDLARARVSRRLAPAQLRDEDHPDDDGYLGSIQFSADGATLLVARFDAPVELWDVASGARLARLATDGANLRATAFSPDGRYVLLQFHDAVRVFEIGGETPVATAGAVSFRRSAWVLGGGSQSQLMTLDRDDALVQRVEIRDIASGATLAAFDGVVATAASADAQRAYIAAADRVVIWDAARRRVAVQASQPPLDALEDAALSADGRFVLARSRLAAALLDGRTGAVLQRFERPDRWTRELAPGDVVSGFDADGGRALFGRRGDEGLAFVSPAGARVLGEAFGPVEHADLGAPGRYVYFETTADYPPDYHVYDGETGAPILSVGAGAPRTADRCRVSLSTRFGADLQPYTTLTMTDTASGALRGRVRDEPTDTLATLSPDGRFVFFGGAIWRCTDAVTAPAPPRTTQPIIEVSVSALADGAAAPISPDGARRLAIRDQDVVLQEAAGETTLTVLLPSSLTGPRLQAGPGGALLLMSTGQAGADFSAAHLWDAPTGAKRIAISCPGRFEVSHELTMSDVTLSPDARHVVALCGVGRRSLHVWNIAALEAKRPCEQAPANWRDSFADGAADCVQALHEGASIDTFAPEAEIARFDYTPSGLSWGDPANFVRTASLDGADGASWAILAPGQHHVEEIPVFEDWKALVAAAKRRTPRCLRPQEREQFGLPPAPPRWCVTGPGREAEVDSANWRPLHPFDDQRWIDWRLAVDAGAPLAPPDPDALAEDLH